MHRIVCAQSMIERIRIGQHLGIEEMVEAERRLFRLGDVGQGCTRHGVLFPLFGLGRGDFRKRSDGHG